MRFVFWKTSLALLAVIVCIVGSILSPAKVHYWVEIGHSVSSFEDLSVWKITTHLARPPTTAFFGGPHSFHNLRVNWAGIAVVILLSMLSHNRRPIFHNYWQNYIIIVLVVNFDLAHYCSTQDTCHRIWRQFEQLIWFQILKSLEPLDGLVKTDKVASIIAIFFQVIFHYLHQKKELVESLQTQDPGELSHHRDASQRYSKASSDLRSEWNHLLPLVTEELERPSFLMQMCHFLDQSTVSLVINFSSSAGFLKLASGWRISTACHWTENAW